MKIPAIERKTVKNIIVALIGALLPLIFSGDAYLILLFCTTGIAVIVVSGLDILFGYSGQISLGHAGFYCVGAYTSAILCKFFSLPPIFTMFVGAAFATVIAILLALPAVKLVHHFLALVTISFGQLAYLFVAHAKDLTDGYSGMNFIPKPSLGFFTIESNFSFFYLIYFFLIVLLIVKSRLMASRTGRAFVAIRENPHAANGMGINVVKYKVTAFAVSAFYTGFAGALYAHLVGFISPESFEMNQSVIFLTMLLFGGMGNLWGSVLGAAALTAVSEVLQKLGSYQMLAYGVFLLVIIVFVPGGITQGVNVVNMIKGGFKKDKAHAET